MDKERKIVDDSLEVIDSSLKGFSVKDTKLKDITIRVGSKILKYELISNTEYDLDKEIREEYSKILSDKMKEIRNVINTKFNETLRTLQMAKDEYIRKEQILLDKLKKSNVMPDITLSHARKGVAIVKGDRANEIVWLVRRTYSPRTIDNQPISIATIEKLSTPIYIMIITVDNKITSVTTRKLFGLELFSHYHQANPDCWGRWSYSKDWKTPDDIIRVADEAEAVLENVNTNSIAKHEPIGLPSLTALKRSIVKTKEKIDNVEKQPTIIISTPSPVSRTGNNVAEDIWST